MLDLVSVVTQHTHHSESNFLCYFFANILFRRELGSSLFLAGQSEAHLYGTPPDSGLVPPGTIPGHCICAVAYYELPVLFIVCSWLSGTPGPRERPGASSEGCFRLRFLLMELLI